MDKPKTCGNCKYWKPLEVDPNHGNCNHERVDTEAYFPEFDEISMVVHGDIEDLWLETGINFGCIHFDPAGE